MLHVQRSDCPRAFHPLVRVKADTAYLPKQLTSFRITIWLVFFCNSLENCMKIAGLILTASMALPIPSFAHAQQQAPVTSAAQAPESLQNVVVSARRFHVEPREFLGYEYAYTLNNGETVRFSRRVGRFYVAIKGYDSVEILPTGPAQFVSSGGATLKFTEGGDALTIDNFELLQGESGLPLVYAFSAAR
jgi:hypothetical protein